MKTNGKYLSIYLLWFTTMWSVASPSVIAADQVPDDLYHDLPFDMPHVPLPEIPHNAVSAEDFRAIGDGITDNTQAFANAIRYLVRKGGGRLTIPRGVWLTGPIELKSHIDLHLEYGALLKFIPDKNKYPLIKTSYEGQEAWRAISPLYAKNVSNISITGKGIIDGSGDAWRYIKKSKMTAGQWQNLVKNGGVVSDDGKLWFPSAESKKGAIEAQGTDIFKYNKEQAEAIKHWLRPVMVALVDSNTILLDGPTFQNSPAWNIHILKSQNVIVRNLQVKNPWYSQNGDGLDLESVKNVLVYDNSFDVGDDAICIKSGRDEYGRKRGMPSENMLIKNNVVYHGHGGIVVGSEMSGGVKNLFFSKATFVGTDIGIRFKSNRGRGGVVENIWISDVDMVDIKNGAISFNMYYGNSEPWDPSAKKAPPPVDETTPQFKNITIKNIRAINVGIAAHLQGLPEMNLSNIYIENAYFESNKGIQIIDGNKIQLSGVKLKSTEVEAVVLRNAKNIKLENGLLEVSRHVKIEGNKSQNIEVQRKKVDHSSLDIRVGEHVPKNTLIIKD